MCHPGEAGQRQQRKNLIRRIGRLNCSHSCPLFSSPPMMPPLEPCGIHTALVLPFFEQGGHAGHKSAEAWCANVGMAKWWRRRKIVVGGGDQAIFPHGDRAKSRWEGKIFSIFLSKGSIQQFLRGPLLCTVLQWSAWSAVQYDGAVFSISQGVVFW